MEELKPGDVVYLKSGSPRMVITEISVTDGTAKVLWTVYGTGKLEQAQISPIALIKKTF